MINAIITDFDGTLVDTYEANLRAYQKAFQAVGQSLTDEQYRKCFGLRFDRFMSCMGIFEDSLSGKIREKKAEFYPGFFDYLKLNSSLIELIKSYKQKGGKTAIASTARRENLLNVVRYLGIEDCFDLIYTGEDVKNGKPSPEIYVKTMDELGVTPSETIIFEDSPVGIEAARASGAKYLIITQEDFS